MKKQKHPHSAIIESLGVNAVRDTYRLTPAKLYAWRMRGIPVAYRVSFAKLAAMNAVVVPADFFEVMK